MERHAQRALKGGSGNISWEAGSVSDPIWHGQSPGREMDRS